LLCVLHGGDGVLRPTNRPKSFRERSNVVSVAVPHAQRRRYPGEQVGCAAFFRIIHAQLRAAIFPPFRSLYRPAERVHDPLHPIANPQYGNSQRQHIRIALGRVSVINRARPARQDNSRRLQHATPLAFLGAGLVAPARAKSRRDSIICPARRCVSRCVCRRGAAQSLHPLAPASRRLLLRSPRRLSLFLSGAHSLAREFQLRPRASTPHQISASAPSTIRRCVPAFPIALPRDAGSSVPASASAVPALPCELPAAPLFPAAPANKSRWSAP